jgi:hypothetical protein
MTKTIVAKKLLRTGVTEDDLRCFFAFEQANGKRGEFQFPIDQLDPALGLLVQVKRQHLERIQPGMDFGLTTQGAKVAYSSQNETVLIEFHVGTMKFPFCLPREYAVKLMDIVKNALPVH